MDGDRSAGLRHHDCGLQSGLVQESRSRPLQDRLHQLHYPRELNCGVLLQKSQAVGWAKRSMPTTSVAVQGRWALRLRAFAHPTRFLLWTRRETSSLTV